MWIGRRAWATLGVGWLGLWSGFAWAQDARQEKTRPTFTAAQIEFFEKEVRPILVERCYECHDPAAGDVGGGLSLASRSDILAGGDTGPAIQPGDPINSLLIEAVRHGERVQMPPDEKIPLAEIATLMKWIEQRAPWPVESDHRTDLSEAFDLLERRRTHWSWQPLTAPPIPAVHAVAWPRDPLDHFILQRLEAKQLTPAPPAPPWVWFRRVHLDLVGLPPTAAQVQDFLARWNDVVTSSDAATDENGATDEGATAAVAEAAQKQTLTVDQQAAVGRLQAETVDRLLASADFGEHWARHWLDLVRYAETCGHEFDYPLPGSYEYRDYVIRAINQDVPYDQWVREHIAGDLLANPRSHPTEGFNESILGTMFWFLGEANHAPVDVRGDQANRIDNQIDVFGKAFLGLTVACARCHDHKFDALSAADYYALAGIVSGMRRDQAVIDTQRIQTRYWDQVRQHQRAADRLMQQQWDLIVAWLDRPEQDGPTAALMRYLSDLPGEQGGRGPTTAEDHPLRLVTAYAKRPAGQPVGQWWDSFRQRILEQARAAERFQAEATLVADFAPASRQAWWAAGWAFAEESTDPWRPSWRSDPAADDGRPRWLAGQPGVVDSGRHGLSLAGTLRSPTFKLTSDKLHLLVRGQQAKVRLVIDGYQMNLHHDLLFSQTLLTIQSPNFEWRTMQGDLGKYLGHQVYLELIDEGEGFLAVDQIWLGGDSPVVAPSPLLYQLCQQQERLDDLTQLVALTGALMRGGVTGELLWAWEDARPESAGELEKQRLEDAAEQGAADQRRIELMPQDQARIQNWVWNWCQMVSPEVDGLNLAAWATSWAELDAELRALDPPPAASRKSWVAAASEGLDHPLYVRGNHRNPGELVPRGTLTALRDLTQEPEQAETPTRVSVAAESVSRGAAREPSGRLALADNIASPDNPLTARVMANRVWLHLLGEGLVATPDDFGVMGGRPTHPELLDHLASELIAGGWSLKQLIRKIVLSQTYAMSVEGPAEAAELDPANQLWHRAQVRRLSGEVLRDAMLQISGRLDQRRYGPSVPAHVTDLMQGRGRPASGPQDGDGRRSIYLEIRRNFLNPWMLVFDTPAPFSAMGKRTRSNVPAQALALLNDPLVHDLAATWAEQVLGQDLTDQQRLEGMFLSAFGRPMRADEWSVFERYLGNVPADQTAGERAANTPPTPERLAVWTQVAHALFNLKEFVFLH